MASISYDPDRDDDIGVASVDSLESSDTEDNPQQQGPFDELFFEETPWPRKAGAMHLFLGILLLFIGIAQTAIAPRLNDLTDNSKFIYLEQNNCYGLSLWISLLAITTGVVACRSALYKDMNCVYVFFVFTSIEVLFLSGALLYLLISYSKKWLIPASYDDNGLSFGLQLSAAVVTIALFLLAILTFIGYYEEVLFGRMQLCRKAVHCFMPCCCPRATTSYERLADGSERPPSLPV